MIHNLKLETADIAVILVELERTDGKTKMQIKWQNEVAKKIRDQADKTEQPTYPPLGLVSKILRNLKS